MKEEGVEEFIERIKKQRGYINGLDAWKLTDHYINYFGLWHNSLSIEDELIVMWTRLKSEKNLKEIIISTKTCARCLKSKMSYDFTKSDYNKDRLACYCKSCVAEEYKIKAPVIKIKRLVYDAEYRAKKKAQREKSAGRKIVKKLDTTTTKIWQKIGNKWKWS